MMRFSTLVKHPADWMANMGPHSDIVMTSRIRLARNVRDHAFPGWSNADSRAGTLDEIRPAVESLDVMKDAFSQDLSELSGIQKQVLVERHLISREHAARSKGCASVMDRKQSVSIMINEEDHLRIQVIGAGLDLTSIYDLIDGIDTSLDKQLDYAFDDTLGYLTACPTNLGTGMRASAMLHLPALVLADQVNPVIQAVNKIGLAVRGLYGEGTEAQANLFQVSNQNTLGESEPAIIARLQRVIEQIIQHERNARIKLVEDRPEMLRDRIGRAYATLRYAHIIASKEALEQLSMLRLGVDLGAFSPESQSIIDILFTEIQPAHLQVAAGKKLDPDARDAMRAEILRAKLKSLPEPDMLSLGLRVLGDGSPVSDMPIIDDE